MDWSIDTRADAPFAWSAGVSDIAEGGDFVASIGVREAASDDLCQDASGWGVSAYVSDLIDIPEVSYRVCDGGDEYVLPAFSALVNASNGEDGDGKRAWTLNGY